MHDNTLDAYLARIRRKLRDAEASAAITTARGDRLHAAVTFRTRLLLVALTTLAVGLGALLVMGNVAARARTRAEVTSVMRANADAQLSALIVTPAARARPRDRQRRRARPALVGVRRRPRDRAARRRGHRRAGPIAASRSGGRRRTRRAKGPSDVRLRAQPVPAAGSRSRSAPSSSVYSVESLERLQKEVVVGSLVLAALVMLAGAFAIRSALDGALRPVAQMTDSAGTGAPTTWTAASSSARRATSSPGSRRRSTGCSPGSPRRDGTSSASRARSPTSCARRWPRCSCAPSWR